jgi:hypothetical protein
VRREETILEVEIEIHFQNQSAFELKPDLSSGRQEALAIHG